jgi:hypothetical protein
MAGGDRFSGTPSSVSPMPVGSASVSCEGVPLRKSREVRNAGLRLPFVVDAEASRRVSAALLLVPSRRQLEVAADFRFKP